MDDDRWLKRLGDKLADFEAPAPDGLWDEIAGSMANAKPLRPLPLWRRFAGYAAAVAAVAAVAWLGVTMWEVEPLPSLPAETFCDNNKNNNNRTLNSEATLNPLIPRREAANVPKNAIPTTQHPVRLVADSGLRVVHSLSLSSAPVKSDSVPPTASSSHHTAPAGSSAPRNESPVAPAASHRPYTKATAANGLSLSLYATNLSGYNSSVRENGPTLRSQYISGLGLAQQSSVRDVVEMSNNNRVVTHKMNHKFPVRAGVSLRYDFSSRFGITTGLQYSYLASDFSWGGEESFYSGSQRLHYVGIPVSAVTTLWHNDRICLYASAGMTMEKCIDGTTVTDYTLNGEPVARESADATEKRLQWSALAAVGVQCRVAGRLSLYAEPGACYYFDNHSSTDNIYKQRPFNFNLNIGLRLTLR